MNSAELTINIARQNDVVTVSLAGEARLNFDAADDCIHDILLLEPKTVILDTANLSFISSVGMCFLINLRRALRAKNCSMNLIGLQPKIQKVLQHAHVLHLFEVPESAPAASEAHS